MISIKTASEQETIFWAQQISPRLQAGDCLAFFGDLASGKSVFSRAIIQQRAGFDIHVPSPTFTLVQTYDQLEPEIWHLDLYRLESSDDALELGIYEAKQDCILLIEWSERLQDALPAASICIHITNGGSSDERILTFKGADDQLKRILPNGF